MNETAYFTRTFIIADRQDITRRGLRGYISDIFGECPVKEVADKQALLRTLAETPKGVVILDYALFDIKEMEELLIIERRFPGISWLLFSSELSEEFIRRMSLEENTGMILKENSGEEIRSALTCAARGERFLCHQIANLLISAPDKSKTQNPLTATETDILRLIAHGKSVKEIAAERHSSIHTITTHKKNIFRKLGVNNIYEATKYALRAGLVDLMEYYI